MGYLGLDVAHNIIVATNTHAQFQGPNLRQAREMLSYKKQGYQFTRAYRNKTWDGRVRLMSWQGRFAAGLAPWLVERLGREGVDVRIDDRRPPPLPIVPELVQAVSNVSLRPYQQEAVLTGMRLERGTIHHPTGAGKTVVMCELARQVGRPGLILVHRKDLLHQTYERFCEQLGDPSLVGIIGDGRFDPKVLTIATFQTLYRRVKDDWPVGIRKWLSEAIGQVHVDEAHHLPAASYSKVMPCLWSARWRFGYSATPYREADPETFFWVAGWLGPTIHHVPSDVLVMEAKLVSADIFMIPVPNHRQQAANYTQDVEEGIIYNGIRNDYIVRLARKLADSNSGPVVILVERLAHGTLLAQMLDCDFVAGDAPTSVRQEAWNGLRSGGLNLLVASRIADEGLDIPPLQFLILAGGGKAGHLTIQKVGRGMRPSEGKRNLFVFDWLDTGRWIGKHAKKRFDTYRSQSAYSIQETAFEEVSPT